MKLFELLEYIYLTGGFTTRSDAARENAETVAEAASCNFIWTLTPRDGFGNVWRLTPKGMDELAVLSGGPMYEAQYDCYTQTIN